jgi:phospholipase C
MPTTPDTALPPDGRPENASSKDSLTRRKFLAASAAGGLALAACGDDTARLLEPVTDLAALPAGDLSSIQHVVVVMMENRSFDHYLGWLSGADGRQVGLAYPNREGVLVSTHNLAPDFQGCGHPDPDHSMAGGRTELNNGACDGWLVAGNNDEYAIGYYRKKDLEFFGKAAPGWTTCDRYFSSMLGPTFPNRMFQLCAQTDRVTNDIVPTTLPTIFDSLFTAGVSAGYYFSDVPFLALWGLKYIAGPQAISRPLSQFFSDCAAGTLPAVSFVEPLFVGSAIGLANDDHPYADIRAGQTFLDRIYRAVTTGPGWLNTLLVITYDEWGGFFEHVPPPTGSVSPIDQAAGYTDGLLGFRVPTVLVSPYAARQFVSHQVLEHCSTLRLIEDRWGLPALTQRDATANSLANALDFAAPKAIAPKYNVPTLDSGAVCPPPTVPRETHWTRLLDLARLIGWPI